MSWHGCMYIVHCIILYIIHCIPDFGPEAPGKDSENQEQSEDQQDDCNLRWNQKLRSPAFVENLVFTFSPFIPFSSSSTLSLLVLCLLKVSDGVYCQWFCGTWDKQSLSDGGDQKKQGLRLDFCRLCSHGPSCCPLPPMGFRPWQWPVLVSACKMECYIREVFILWKERQ